MNAKVCMLVLFVPLFAISSLSQAVLSGQLLKSNAKPLQYTEVELVPVAATRMVDDPRLNTISDSAGRFKFTDLPRGKYTLSINFGEKPSELSPYDTFFFPAAEKRSDARVFEMTPGANFEKLVFKLPPALIQQKISGKVVYRDGAPVIGAFLALRDLKVDQGIFFGSQRTGKLGEFSLNAFAGRRYQVGAMMINQVAGRPPDVLDFVGAAESEAFVLEKEPVVLLLVLQPNPEIERLREKYMGALLHEFTVDTFIGSKIKGD